MFKCWHPKDRARDGIAAVMVHLSFCLLSGILQIRCEMMFTFAGCGMQYSICSDRLKKEKKYYIMVLTISGEGKVAMKKFLGRFFLLFMMILLIGGCARQKETENVMKKSDNQEKVMRYVNYSRFSGDGINHLKLKSSAEQTIACYLLEGLMRIYQYELQYGMAARYEISENQKVYTFYLRDDACYSDGMPVTAGDFLRAFQRLMEPENFNSYAAIIKNAEDIYQGKKKIEELGVTVLDEKTLQIELEHPQVQFLQLLALRSFAPIREDAAEILRPEDCNGPFTLETWSEDLVGMKKNPYCWERDNIKLDKVEAVCLESSDEAYERFVKGEVDVMPIPLKGAEKYSAGIQKKVMTGICESLYLDLQTEGPLQCREFRQALNYALNRVEYKENMDSDFLVPNARYVPENGLGILKTYTENYQDLPCTKYGNQKLAEEKLGEALKKMNISGAEDVNIRLLVNDDPWSIQEGTEIKRQWEKKLGISVELETATGDAFWAEKDNGTVTLTGVIAEYADMMAYLQSWNYDYTYGEEGNQSDTVQKCLRDAERQTDEQIRLSTLYKAEKALMEDVPMIPLQLRKESLLLNRNLTGFETSMNLAGGGYEFLYADFK